MLRPVEDKNVADHVLDRLREAIQDGRYPPGTRLVERRIAAELGVSHIPLREALTRLADEGLVERLPRRGSRVAVLTLRQLDEISSLRALLEGFVAVRAQAHADAPGRAELREIVDAMCEAGAKGDAGAMLALDRRFHERLWTLADHALVLELASQLRGRINHFLAVATTTLAPEDLANHAEMHAALLEAILGDDPDAARTTMEHHVTLAAERVRRALAAPAIDGDAR